MSAPATISIPLNALPIPRTTEVLQQIAERLVTQILGLGYGTFGDGGRDSMVEDIHFALDAHIAWDGFKLALWLSRQKRWNGIDMSIALILDQAADVGRDLAWRPLAVTA